MKRFLPIVVFAAIILLGWLFVRSVGRPEPSYKGKTLSQWLWPLQRDALLDDIKEPPDHVEAEEAVHAIGTNAIPTLLDWFQAKDLPIKAKFVTLLNRQPFIHFHYLGASAKHQLAIQGFKILGKNAAPAVPALLQLAENPKCPCGETAADLLMLIDPKAGSKAINDQIIRQRQQTSLSNHPSGQ